MRQGTGWVAAILVAIGIGLAPVDARAGGGIAGGVRRNQTDIRSMLETQLRQRVAFTNEEWLVIEPKWWRVASLQLVLGKGPIFRLAQNTQRYAGRPTVRTVDPLTQLQTQEDPAVIQMAQPFRALGEQLTMLTRDESAAPGAIEIKLTEYRAERDKLEAALTAAQLDLQSVLTLRQESWMVLAEYLD